jgi:threonine-phosphate decarboxylase
MYGIRKEDFLDYSANINPLGLPQNLREILISNLDNLVNYPDTECTELKQDISRYLKVDEDRIIVGNGASEVIFLLFEVLRPKKVLIPSPTFAEYSKAAVRCGADIEYFPLKEEDNFIPDREDLFSKLQAGVDALFLCNPNNPTSTLLTKSSLLEIIEYSSRRNVFVIIDEAFIELTAEANENSMAEVLSRFNNLFIIRAFTKLFAIPGLRLGYGLGGVETVKKMWEIKMPWSVNSLACSVGPVLEDKTGYMKKTREWIKEELEWFYDELVKIPGLKVFKPNTNFILLKILEEGLNVKILKDKMASKGILIRDASNFKFLNEKFFRIAIKDRERNTVFLRTLKEVMG